MFNDVFYAVTEAHSHTLIWQPSCLENRLLVVVPPTEKRTGGTSQASETVVRVRTDGQPSLWTFTSHQRLRQLIGVLSVSLSIWVGGWEGSVLRFLTWFIFFGYVLS